MTLRTGPWREGASATLGAAAALLVALMLGAGLGPAVAQEAGPPAVELAAESPAPAAAPAMPLGVEPAGQVAEATLPQDLSPWAMFLAADPVVKAVLIGLAFASVVTWTVWLAKTIEIVLAKRRVGAASRILAGVRSTSEGVERLDQLVQLRSLGSELGQGYYFGRPLSGASGGGIGPLLHEQMRWGSDSATNL